MNTKISGHNEGDGAALTFVRELMDGFRYRRSDGRNIVTLAKETRGAGAG